MKTPIAIDLFCGLGGWSEALISEGWDVTGYDIEAHEYGDQKYPGNLVIQDVLTIHGSQFKDAALIVASPPCQAFSYMAMPWSKAKAIEADYKSGKRDVKKLTALFDACFRIQREASEAAGHHIPMVVENVRGAQKWVGKAKWNFGSYYLWGDVPALMPITQPRRKSKSGSWDQTRENYNPDKTWENDNGRKNGPSPGSVWSEHPASVSAHRETGRHLTNQAESDGLKQPGISGPRANGKGDKWFQDGAAAAGSKSNARKAASAMIAKIPLPLACWIAKCYFPKQDFEVD